MSTYELVLFIHLLSLVAAFALAGILHLARFRMRAARTVADLRAWVAIGNRIGPLMPLPALGLFGSGAYLLSDAFSWSAGWAAAGIAGLVAMEVLGGAVEGPRARALAAELAEADPSATLGPALAAHGRDPVGWTVTHLETGLALGIMVVMVAKPDLGPSLGVLAGAAVLAAASAVPFWRTAPAARGAETEARAGAAG